MKIVFISLVLFEIRLELTANEVKFVKFEKSSDKDFPTECAIQALSNSYAGIEINNMTGDCTAKPHTFKPLDAPNTSFLKKKTCIVTYEGSQFKNRTSNRTNWTFPGQFGVGAKFEVLLKLPTEPTWVLFCLAIRPPIPSAIRTGRVCLNRETRLMYFSCYDGNEFFDMTFPEQFEAGKVYTIEFRAGEENIAYYIDGHLMVEIEYCVPPETVTRFEYSYNSSEPVADVMKLIFQGL